jgi:hypothetical protein
MNDDGQITVMFLPCSCTPLLQPMGQNVIPDNYIMILQETIRIVAEEAVLIRH